MAATAKIPLNRKLIEDIGFNTTTEADMFGLEIELEGQNIVSASPFIQKFWTMHNDGSLRKIAIHDQAIEYVFKAPLNMKDTQTALLYLYDHLTKPDVKVYDSYRTSIHVHVNCLHETVRTIANFITLAIIFDELFVSQNGETRAGNNFCLRAKDAEGQVANLAKSIAQYGSLYNIQPEHRYSSFNVSSLLKFGTIEFRSLECTTDLDRVLHWIKTIQALKVAARDYENPREIISRFSRHGPLGFMMAHLGHQYTKYSTVPGAYQMLHNGMRLAQDFAYCSDWQMPDPNAKPPPRKRAVKQKVEIEPAQQWVVHEEFVGGANFWANHPAVNVVQAMPPMQVNNIQPIDIPPLMPAWFLGEDDDADEPEDPMENEEVDDDDDF